MGQQTIHWPTWLEWTAHSRHGQHIVAHMQTLGKQAYPTADILVGKKIGYH